MYIYIYHIIYTVKGTITLKRNRLQLRLLCKRVIYYYYKLLFIKSSLLQLQINVMYYFNYYFTHTVFV